METISWTGVVREQKKTNVVRSKTEGKGPKAKRVTVEEEVFSVTLENESSGAKVRLQRREDPFDLVPGDVVNVTIRSSQTRLEDADKRKGK